MRIFLFFSLLCLSLSCTSQPMKIGVISDIHYLSEQLMDDGLAINRYVQSNARTIKDTPLVLDQVIAAYTDSDIEALFIAGDLTKDGEKQSHLDLVAKLKPLLDKGIKIYVVPGNHDINMPNSMRYEGHGTFPVDNITPDQFASIYTDCGYGSALKRDSASLSYVAQLADDKWLLALDGCLYKEYTTRSISGGRISNSTQKWIEEVLDEAQKNNIQVVGMMHHALVEHFTMQETLLPQYIIEDWRKLANMFADKGMRIIFTGHFHANDITGFTSDAGNEIYDVETGTLATFPFAYRFVELSNSGADIETRNITQTLNSPNLVDSSKVMLRKLTARLVEQKLKGKRIPISPVALAKIQDLAGDLFLLHMAGDEALDGDTKRKLQELASELGMPMSGAAAFLQLDFPPLDNNVKLSFVY